MEHLLIPHRVNEESVTVEAVMAHMKANSQNAKHLVSHVLKELAKDEHKSVVAAEHIAGSSRWAACTAPAGKKPEAVERLEWLLPGYFA